MNTNTNTEEEILGYEKDGLPIHPTKRGYIYTAACITCRECGKIIRGMGGPRFGSICIGCATTGHQEAK